MCRISIIVPVYNVEKYLKKCVDSILGQTFTDFELLLIDDGSTDNSGSICDELAKTDNRIKVIHKENGGLSDARNIGIEVAKGDFIGFIDSDDYIDED
ncbi:glycosyltransferase, partial [Enterococcus faecium]|nr:glycosyltransferase [Enterococcus faecium]